MRAYCAPEWSQNREPYFARYGNVQWYDPSWLTVSQWIALTLYSEDAYLDGEYGRPFDRARLAEAFDVPESAVE